MWTLSRLRVFCLFAVWMTGLSHAILAENVPPTNSLTVTPTTVYDFDKMRSLIKRMDVLEQAAPDILLGFYDPQLETFQSRPGSEKQKICITSTCYALLTLALSSSVYEPIVSWHEDDDKPVGGKDLSMSYGDKTPRKIPMRRVLRKLLASKWREGDLFQVPLLIYTLLRVGTKSSEPSSSLLRSMACEKDQFAVQIRRLIAAVLTGIPQRRLGTRQVHSDYITYQVCKVLALLQSQNEHQLADLPENAVPEEVPSAIFMGLLACGEVSSNELCRQLAYRSAGDCNSFDVIRLAYSLLTYIRSTESLAGLAGRELVPGEGPAPETRVAPLNKKLVGAALAAFFDEQTSEGLWDKGQPIYKSFKEGIGRNLGGAFVFSVNTLGSLLCQLPAEDFRPHLRALEKTLEWIENHQNLEIISDHIDPDSGQCYGRPLRGWNSPHSGNNPDYEGPLGWSTAQVLKCVSWMSTTIRQLMHNDVLEEFHGVAFSKNGVQAEGWDRMLDTDLPLKTKCCRTIKSVLEERVVKPFASSIENPSYGAAYSAILFGPPGTAKTSICEALAQRLGYDFVVIDTAAFLADGLSNVAARIRYVFSRLMHLNRCVILFDEIEEFALDRETKGLSMESRMLTTAMLTAINDLRRTKKSVFFIATNRLRAFDSAITRRGRFDMQLFVGTPNLDSRVVQFEQQLETTAQSRHRSSQVITKSIREKAVTAYRTYLSSVWTEDAMFMNYLEGIQFAKACADVLLDRKELAEKEMSTIMRQQAAVMTVRGSAREEYLASMELSRI